MTQLIRFDWAIKHVLRQKANFDILEGFLSELLGQDILIRQLLESESNQQDEFDKFNRVDLLVENQHGELIIIEIQNDTELDYFQRMLYGTSKAIVEHIQLGQPYAKVKKVIAVSIVYFDLGQGEDYIYHGTTSFVGRHERDDLQLSKKQKTAYYQPTIKALYPEYYVIKVEQFDDITRDHFDEWIYFLKHEQIKPEFQARGLQQAKEKLDILKMSPEQRQAYQQYAEDLRYKASMIHTQSIELQYQFEEGFGKGFGKGQHQKALDIARQLLDVLDDETISQKTGLPLADIQQLRASHG